MRLRAEVSVERLDERGGDSLPGLFGLRVTELTDGRLMMEFDVAPRFLAPNGYLHAASVIALADTAAGAAGPGRMSGR